MIQFRCVCGQVLQAREEHAGLSVNCPGCGVLLPVPGTPEVVRPAPPGSRAAAPSPSEQTGARRYPSPEPLPSRRRRDYEPARGMSGKALAFLIGGVTAAALLLAGGVFWVYRNAQNRVEEAQRRTESQNNLKQIILAMHNYSDTYRRLPTHAIYSKAGKPLLSWRVAILPWIEQKHLYNQFKLDEPWDSPHNSRLLERMPRIYAPVLRDAPPNTTHYQVFTGPKTVFPGPTPLRWPADIPDGTSNTIFIVEADEAVPWTRPADSRLEPGGPLPPLGGLWDGTFLVAMGDGSVRTLDRRTVSDRTLRLAIDPSDGQVLGDDF